MVLWIPITFFVFRLPDSHRLWSGFPSRSAILWSVYIGPNPGCITTSGLASSDFARHYFRNLFWFLFLRVLRCFTSPGSPHAPIDSVHDPWLFIMGVAPFGNLRLSLFAADRSLSQLVASFFGSWCQGIHLVLLLAWTSFRTAFSVCSLVLWITWVSQIIVTVVVTLFFATCVTKL